MQGEFSFSGIKVIDDIPYVVGAESVQKVFESFGIRKGKKAVYKFISKSPLKRRVVVGGRSKIAIPISEIKRWIRKNYPIVWESIEKGALSTQDEIIFHGDDEKEIISKNFKIMSNLEKVISEMEKKIKDIELDSMLSETVSNTEMPEKLGFERKDGAEEKKEEKEKGNIVEKSKSEKMGKAKPSPKIGKESGKNEMISEIKDGGLEKGGDIIYSMGEQSSNQKGEKEEDERTYISQEVKFERIWNISMGESPESIFSPSDKILFLANSIIKTLAETPPKVLDMEKISEAQKKLVSALEFIENVSKIRKESQM